MSAREELADQIFSLIDDYISHEIPQGIRASEAVADAIIGGSLLPAMIEAWREQGAEADLRWNEAMTAFKEGLAKR